MNMLDALRLCHRDGKRVRPVKWRTLNPDHWIECRASTRQFFVECGTMEEFPHALRLADVEEFLVPWEEVPR